MTKRTLTAEHKAALERGRVAGRAIKRYLRTLEDRHSRGPRRGAELISADLDRVEAELRSAQAVKKIQLIQRRIELREELEAVTACDLVDVQAVEEAFIRHVADYSLAKGISYSAWREFGVPAAVLNAGGLHR